MSCFLHAPIHHSRRLGLAMLVAIGLCGVTTAGSATPTASAATYTCGFISNSVTTGNGLSWILMSNGAWNLVRVSGGASFRTCPNGSIFVNWSPSLIDNHNDLSFLGGYMQFRTNRGRVITSSRQYVTGFYGAQATSYEQSHYDVGAGEYPVQVKFVYLARKNANAGTTIGSINKTCSVHWNNIGTRRCSSGQGSGGW